MFSTTDTRFNTMNAISRLANTVSYTELLKSQLPDSLHLTLSSSAIHMAPINTTLGAMRKGKVTVPKSDLLVSCVDGHATLYYDNSRSTGRGIAIKDMGKINAASPYSESPSPAARMFAQAASSTFHPITRAQMNASAYSAHISASMGSGNLTRAQDGSNGFGSAKQTGFGGRRF
jgi:hypothetical protein